MKLAMLPNLSFALYYEKMQGIMRKPGSLLAREETKESLVLK